MHKRRQYDERIRIKPYLADEVQNNSEKYDLPIEKIGVHGNKGMTSIATIHLNAISKNLDSSQANVVNNSTHSFITGSSVLRFEQPRRLSFSSYSSP
jgi:hypothetical protein